MEVVFDYLPIFVLATLCGVGGYFQQSDNFYVYHLVKRVVSSGCMGVILLLLVEHFFNLPVKIQYAIVLSVVFFSPEKILEYLEKLKRLK